MNFIGEERRLSNGSDLIQRFIALEFMFKRLRFDKLHNVLSRSEFTAVTKIVVLASGFNKTEDPVGKCVSMKRVSSGMWVSPAMVTKTMNSLEQQGIVQRITNADDRREVKVCLTERGFQVWQTANKNCDDFMTRVFEHLGEEKACEFISIAEELIKLASEEIECSGQGKESEYE